MINTLLHALELIRAEQKTVEFDMQNGRQKTSRNRKNKAAQKSRRWS